MMGNDKQRQGGQRRFSNVFKVKPRTRRSDDSVKPPTVSIALTAPFPLTTSPNEIAPTTVRIPKIDEEPVEPTRIADNSMEFKPYDTETNDDFASGQRENSPHLGKSVQRSNSRDRVRTEIRYVEAVKQLQESLKRRQANWESFNSPEFDISPNDPFPQTRDRIMRIIDERKGSIKNVNFWSKGKQAMERIFTATSPFAKTFLQAASQGQLVLLRNLKADVIDTSPIWLAVWRTTAIDNGSPIPALFNE